MIPTPNASRRFSYLAAVIATVFLLLGCSSVNRSGRSDEAAGNALQLPGNQRIYRADYGTTFHASADVLKKIDSDNARLVRFDSGTIIVNRGEEVGAIKVLVTEISDQETRVEFMAQDRRKTWRDDVEAETRDLFFSELDAVLVNALTDKPTAEESVAQPMPAPETLGSNAEKKQVLLTRLMHDLQLGEEERFLEKLSLEDLSTLEKKIESIDSLKTDKDNVARRCSACYIDLARFYHDSEQYARSAEALKIAISVDPGNAVAHCNLGEIYKHLRLFDDAIRELQEAEKLNPDLADIYINLGIIYDDYVIDDQKALEYYRKYLEMGGTDKQVQEWIRAIEAGS